MDVERNARIGERLPIRLTPAIDRSGDPLQNAPNPSYLGGGELREAALQHGHEGGSVVRRDRDERVLRVPEYAFGAAAPPSPRHDVCRVLHNGS